MDTIETIVIIIVAVLVIILSAASSTLTNDTSAYGKAREAIKQCEAELPRHQQCDYRIETFIKGTL